MTQDIEQFRPGFEAWAREQELHIVRDDHGNYYNNETQTGWDAWTASKREASTEPSAQPVAYAVTAARGGIHKLSITKESAERKAAVWREEWPDNGCRVRPLVFADEVVGGAQKDEAKSDTRLDEHEIAINALISGVAACARAIGPNTYRKVMEAFNAVINSAIEKAETQEKQP